MCNYQGGVRSRGSGKRFASVPGSCVRRDAARWAEMLRAAAKSPGRDASSTRSSRAPREKRRTSRPPQAARELRARPRSWAGGSRHVTPGSALRRASDPGDRPSPTYPASSVQREFDFVLTDHPPQTALTPVSRMRRLAKGGAAGGHAAGWQDSPARRGLDHRTAWPPASPAPRARPGACLKPGQPFGIREGHR